jgi:PAB-dependent poly(A)-specific ribonuclease subunit 2
MPVLVDCHLGLLCPQTETHDSIEDACTALALYRRYVELQAEGEFEITLQGLYALGHATNWKA